jgi:hypothetical protein
MGIVDPKSGQETKLEVPELQERAKWMRAGELLCFV